MGWLDRAIDGWVKRGVDKAVEDFTSSPKFKKQIDEIIVSVLREPQFKWFWFIKHMQARMMEVDKSLPGERAWELAVQAYREFLKDEKIEFGDPRFDWSRDGARDLIQAYEIDYWESAA